MARLYQMYSVLPADQDDEHLDLNSLFQTRQAAERYVKRGTENWQYETSWPGWPLRIVPINVTVEVVNE